MTDATILAGSCEDPPWTAFGGILRSKAAGAIRWRPGEEEDISIPGRTDRPTWPGLPHGRPGDCGKPIGVPGSGWLGHVTGADQGGSSCCCAILGEQEGPGRRVRRALGDKAENSKPNERSAESLRKGANVDANACSMRRAVWKAMPHMGVDRVTTRTYYLRSARQGPAGAHATGPEGRWHARQIQQKAPVLPGTM